MTEAGASAQERRTARLREEVGRRGWDAYLVSDLRNVRYLTGFTGSAARMVVTPSFSTFITDFRYTEQGKEQVRGSRVVTAPGEYDQAVVEALQEAGASLVGLPAGVVTLEVRDGLQAKMGEAEFVASPDLVASLRRIKDGEEIEAIERAVGLASRVFDAVLEEIRPGALERDIALELEYRMRREGAQAAAFDSIVASGWRSALPHGIAADKKIEAGELVTVDMGCRLDGYNSDMTRTVCVGEPAEDARKIYEVVRRAQERCARDVTPGMHGADADALARGVIEEEGYGRYFGHGTGHGIGLDVHEGPRLGPRAKEEDVLEIGTVFTVEPGIYIPGMGGVRIEDCVVMEEAGPRVLTPNGKDLLIL